MLITKGLASRIFTALVQVFDADEGDRAKFLEPSNLVALNDSQGYPLTDLPRWRGLALRLDHVETATGIVLGVGQPIVLGTFRNRVNQVNDAISRAVEEGGEFILLDSATANLIYDQMVKYFSVEEGRRLDFVDQVTNHPTHDYTPSMMPFGCDFCNNVKHRRQPLLFSCHWEYSTDENEAMVLKVNQWLDQLNAERKESEEWLANQLATSV
jgi:hypothetical protein